MTQLHGPISAGLEPIPGYTLRRRLGAGGFGEVWLADAPGGLQKAIKLVYGTVDQERASSELRSLQRIRQVHHPFLLSLERIEVVNNQIVIVTELAECSLVERFQLYRGKGLPGIPRDLLIDMLRDAADALDFLSQKHELQHLDIKPGNLLIVADRIKVADFGLVKDLHEQNQSLVGGLTPTYAAPEIFDGRPDRRSDQYSLAIVYQELLTGAMPFTGRTTAELARQHLNQAPDLESLPPADRQIIARALAKNPLDRFSSCRQLIDQLARVRAVAAMLPTSTESREEAQTAVSRPTTSTSTSGCGRQRVLSSLEVDGSLHNWVPPRCLFVGIGGLGCKSLMSLFETMKDDADALRPVNDHEWLAIDTDSETLDQIGDSTNASKCLPPGTTAQIQLFRPQEYRAAHPQLFRAISRRWLYNIPRSLKTEGVRPLGMLAYLDHYEQISRTLTSKLTELVKAASDDRFRSAEPIRIYVISSAHGGTGGAIFTEIGYLIRDVMRQLNWHNYRLSGNLTVATTVSANQSEMASAAAVACCSELTHCMDADSMIPPLHFANTASINNPQRPFDWVNIFDGGLYGSSSEERVVEGAVAEALWLDSQTLASNALGASRVAQADVRLSWLRTLQSTKLRTATPINATSLSRLCCAESVRKAMAYILGPHALQVGSGATTVSNHSATCSGEMPLTANATDDILSRVLVQLRCQFDDTLTEEQLLGTWVQRLSEEADQVELQFSDDLNTLHTWLGNLIQARVLNWKQLEKLQLVLIDRLMDMANFQDSAIVGYLAQFDFPGTTFEVASRVRDYLRRFAMACMNLVQQLQKRGRELGQRLRSWNDSMQAEISLATGQDLPSFESLGGEWAQVAARVVAVLESTFQRMTIQSFESVIHPVEQANESDAIGLPHLLSLARDLCDRFARDFRISLDATMIGVEPDGNGGICVKQLEEYLPSLSHCGGDVHRLIIVPQDQMQSVSNAIQKGGFAETSTFIPSSFARQAYVFTDAINLNLSQLVAMLWRPSHKTLQLAERLLTRVDIEWPSVGNLMSIGPKPAADAVQAPIAAGPDNLDVFGTQQISHA